MPMMVKAVAMTMMVIPAEMPITPVKLYISR